MKGQHKVFNEMFIFSFGIIITSFVLLSFTVLEDEMRETTTKDQLQSISELVRSSVIKVIQIGPNSTLEVDLPREVSGVSYTVSLDKNAVLRTYLNQIPRNEVRDQLFNIAEDYIVIESEIDSNLGYLIVEIEDNKISLKP